MAPDDPPWSSRFRSSATEDEEDRYLQLSPEESVLPLLVLLRIEVAIMGDESELDVTGLRGRVFSEGESAKMSQLTIPPNVLTAGLKPTCHVTESAVNS